MFWVATRLVDRGGHREFHLVARDSALSCRIPVVMDFIFSWCYTSSSCVRHAQNGLDSAVLKELEEFEGDPTWSGCQMVQEEYEKTLGSA